LPAALDALKDQRRAAALLTRAARACNAQVRLRLQRALSGPFADNHGLGIAPRP